MPRRARRGGDSIEGKHRSEAGQFGNLLNRVSVIHETGGTLSPPAQAGPLRNHVENVGIGRVAGIFYVEYVFYVGRSGHPPSRPPVWPWGSHAPAGQAPARGSQNPLTGPG